MTKEYWHHRLEEMKRSLLISWLLVLIFLLNAFAFDDLVFSALNMFACWVFIANTLGYIFVAIPTHKLLKPKD